MTAPAPGKLVSNSLGSGVVLPLRRALGFGRVLGGKIGTAGSAEGVSIINGFVALAADAVILGLLGALEDVIQWRVEPRRFRRGDGLASR